MKTTNFFVIIFCLFLAIYNFCELNISTTDPYYVYIQNSTIRIFYFIAILIDILVIAIMIYFMQNLKKSNHNKNKFISKIFIIIAFFFMLNVFLELYYGSTFYYGEVRDKQVLPFLTNNWGFLGSAVVLFISLTIFADLNWKFSGFARILQYFLILVFVLMIFLCSYLLLLEPWKM